MLTDMKIKAIAPWFGAKRNLADWIISQLGPHRFYVEPFCGSMAVLLAKAPAACEMVNDLHGDLINLARVIASDEGVRLYEKLSRTLFCEGIYQDCRDRHFVDEPRSDFDRAYDYFVLSWQGRNGVSGTNRYNYPVKMIKRYTAQGGDGASRFRSAVESLPVWHERLRGVTITRQCGIDMVERMRDEPGTVIYADPPYLRGGQRSSSTTYLHEFTDKHYFRLATILREKKQTRVIVSGYEDERLNNLYAGWHKLTRRVRKLVGTNTENAAEADEVIFINGPPMGGHLDFGE